MSTAPSGFAPDREVTFSDPVDSRKPRILIVTKWAPPQIGGPKNLYNLFSLVPPESYFVLTSADAIDPFSAETGSWLPARYIFFDRKTESGFREFIPGSAKPAGRPTGQGRDKIRRFRFLGRSVVEALYVLRNVRRIVRAARRAVRERGITLLLGISDDGPALIGTYWVHKKTGIPYALYLFDLYRGNDFSAVGRFLARVFEPWLVRGASAVITTNEVTQDFLRQRYGRSIRSCVIPNSAFPEEFERFRNKKPADPPYTIVFTGNVYWAQEGAVLNLIRAMDKLRDLPVRLLLYIPNATGKVRSAVEGRPNVTLTSASQSEVARVQCEATLLVLPLSWGTKAPDIIATATPGKYTDYLASGRPLLVHAPSDSCVAREVKKHGSGIVVDRDDVAALAHAIREFLGDPSAGRDYVDNALRVFEASHDARKNARKLWSILCRATS